MKVLHYFGVLIMLFASLGATLIIIVVIMNRCMEASLSWSVNVFPIRKKTLFRRRRKTKGYGWSASCSAGGYKYDRTPQPTIAAALKVATLKVEEMGGTVTQSNAPLLEAGNSKPTDA